MTRADAVVLLPEAGHDGGSWPGAFVNGLGVNGLGVDGLGVDGLGVDGGGSAGGGRRVLRPDWPSLVDGAGVVEMAAAVRGLAEGELRRGGKVHVVGQGLGALVAVELALGRRKLAASLTLIGAHPGSRTGIGPPPWVTSALDGALSLVDGERGGPTQADRLRPLLHAPDFDGPGAELVEAGLVRVQWAIAATADSYGRLPRIDLPTLVIHGSADVVAPAENGRTVADRIPGAVFALEEGAGHCVVQERPGVVAARVRAFLSSLG